jgi:hypothetical protein
MFKCVSTKGDVFYNDKPCPVTEKETLIKADKAPKNAYIPPAFVNDKEETSIGVASEDNVGNQQVNTKDKKKPSFDGRKTTKNDGSEQGSNEPAADDDNSNTEEDHVSKSIIEELKNTTRTKTPLSSRPSKGKANNSLKV